MSAPSIIDVGHGWVAIDKPYDLSVHNADSSHSNMDAITLIQKWLDTDQSLRAEAQPERGFSPAPVHRLDVGTSGVLLVALSKTIARELAQEMASPRPEKSYVAIFKGAISSPVEWSHPLTEKAEGRRDPAGRGDRKACLTRVRPLERNRYFTLAEVQILTGRTHQIRRHGAIHKHPIIGDTRYGDPEYAKRIEAMYKFQRLALHAAQLKINIGQKLYTFESPYPESFRLLMPQEENGTLKN